MKSYLLSAGILVLAIINIQCSSSRGVATLPSGIQAANYKTYRIKPYEEWDPQHQATMNTIDQVRIEAALKEKVENRGLKRGGQPDMFVTYMLEVNSEKSYNNNYNRGSYYGRYYDPYNSPYYNGNDRPGYNESKKGKLFVQVVDVRTNKIIWYASAEQPVVKNPNKADKKVKKAMEKIFEDFPFGQSNVTAETGPVSSEN